MGEKQISDIANGFGLTLETVYLPDNPNAIKVFKGANPIFVGTEEAVREFLSTYENSRPGLYEASMYGYKE